MARLFLGGFAILVLAVACGDLNKPAQSPSEPPAYPAPPPPPTYIPEGGAPPAPDGPGAPQVTRQPGDVSL